MKKLVLAGLAWLAIYGVQAQTPYEVSPDKDGGRIFKGIISRDLLEKDTAFYNTWYAANYKAYSPNTNAVAGLKQQADSLQLLVFMGTWCEDSHFIIPRLFHLLDAAGYGKEKVSLVGTDRSKKTLGNLSEAFHVTNVPTIILLRNGRELGRVVEYGTTGEFDKDLAEILKAAGPASR